MFASKLSSCMGKAFPKLKPAMEAEMAKRKPISEERLAAYELSEEALNCLSEQLTALLEGDAWLAIENHQKSSSLERWRLLSSACDPRGAYSELMDTRSITNPQRIRNAKGIIEGINAWEGVQLRHQLATGMPILTEHAKKYSLLNLMPQAVEKNGRSCLQQVL